MGHGLRGREADERLLGWLKARAGGATCTAIARKSGDVQRAAVIRATNDVRAADLLESGERPVDVAPAYWPVGRGA